MKYMGSKQLIAKYILPIILKDRIPGQLYVEPFIGGGNIFQYVNNPRVGLDCDKYVIQALLLIKDSPELLPKCADEISVEFYKNVKKDVNHFLHGYIGFACSFGGKYFGGRVKSSYPSHPSDRVNSQYKASQKQSKLLQGSVILGRDFRSLKNLKNCIIYCDPPYANTTSYKTPFNHEIFWDYCRMWVKGGNKVYVSEYNAPEDFICIWSKSVKRRFRGGGIIKQAVEKLFVHRSSVYN